MSLRKVLKEWLDWGVEPDLTQDLEPNDQRQLVSDIFGAEPEFLYDAFGESIARNPQYRERLIPAFRSGDFLQVGAICDEMFRGYLIGSEWLHRELQEIHEQESYYTGDQ